MIRCNTCGRENEDTFRFCLDCGSEISSPAPPAAPPSVAAPARANPPGAAPDPAPPTPIPLTEVAPPTGMMPMQSAATGPAGSLPSVSSATPPGGMPRHTPIPPSALEPTAPSAQSTPSAPGVPVAPPGPPPSPEAPTAAPDQAMPVPPISAPAPGESPAVPDHARPCPTCGAQVAAGHPFCGACGARADALGPLPATAASTAAAAAAGGTQVMGSVNAPELSAPTFRVTVIDPDGKEARTVPLTGPETVAGDESAAIPIPGDPFVHSAHLTLRETTGVLRVEDAGSETGTFLKIDAGTPVPLPPGAALRFGRQRLRLENLTPLAPLGAGETQEWGSPDEGARYRLVQELEGGGDGAAWLLTEGRYQIGREQGDLAFPDDGYVSGSHGQIQVGADGSATYEDLGSSNGSFLRLTRSTVLSAGDFLLVGMHLLRIDLQ